MFPGDDQLQKLNDIVGPLKFALKLPESPDNFFAQSGPIPTVPHDQRRFVRSHLRVVGALQYRHSLPSFPRPSEWHKIVTCDVSRNGIRFLHSEQLFPNEQMTLLLPDGRPRYVEIVRCQRLGDCCFDIGATFVGELEMHQAVG